MLALKTSDISAEMSHQKVRQRGELSRVGPLTPGNVANYSRIMKTQLEGDTICAETYS